MNALTVNQPWAMMVALGAKLIETRSWPTRYRGRLAIHASKKLTMFQLALCYRPPFRDILSAWGIDIMAGELRPGNNKFPLGAIIATVDLIDCMPTNDIKPWQFGWQIGMKTWVLTDQEKALGDFLPDRYAWLLDNVQMLPEPIPAKGKLGLWKWQ